MRIICRGTTGRGSCSFYHRQISFRQKGVSAPSMPLANVAFRHRFRLSAWVVRSGLRFGNFWFVKFVPIDNMLRTNRTPKPIMSADRSNGNDLVKNSSLYKEFQAELNEILRHKWLESEKAGRDIGFEQALTDWIIKHRSKWRKARQSTSPT